METEQKVLSRLLAEYVVGLAYRDVPGEVIQKAKLAVLDQLGCQLIGSTLSWNQSVYRFVRDFGERAESTIVNYGTKALAHDAAYVNGTFGHGAELDDGTFPSSCHPGAICVPIAMALGEKDKLSGQKFLTAIVIGYQVAWSLGQLLIPGIITRGFHPQSALGVFVATAVAGRLLGLKEETLCQAFGIAGSHASGTLEYDHSGGEVKRVHTGIAVRNGIQSAMLASYGLTGPLTIFEGERGICRVFAGQCNKDKMVHGLYKDWGILHQSVKRYPCNASINSSIDVMSQLMTENHIDYRQVEKIDVYVSEHIRRHAASIAEPRDALGAQFSLAYSLAIRLLKGGNDLEFYSDDRWWRDPEVLGLIHRVEIHADPDRGGEKGRASRIVVKFKDGRTLEGYEEIPKGVPANPWSDKEIVQKFEELASSAVPDEQVAKIRKMVEELEKLKDTSQIVALLVRQR